MTNKRIKFCESFVRLKGSKIRFDGRPYLPDVYASNARNLVIRASQQVEKSTFLVNTILYEAAVRPGVQILFVCPRLDQARVFSNSRLLPSLRESPVFQRMLLGNSRNKTQVMNIQFRNHAQLYVRAAFHSADASRGISADLLLIDEFQDIAAGDLPVLQETMSHSECPRTVITGTPKLIDNHLDAVFSQSTAHEWTLACDGCGRDAILDERCLGADSVICPECETPLDPSLGRWVPRNPASKWGQGFWINHLMVPWLNYNEIIDRQRVYDLARFKNEVLGLPTAMGEHIVTRAELEACCGVQAMARSLVGISQLAAGRLIAGIDWGGSAKARTVIVVGYMRADFVFEVVFMAGIRPNEDPTLVLDSVAKVCRAFQVRSIAADGGGNGHVLNRLLLDRLPEHNSLYAILYSAAGQAPRQEGALWKWTVNRSATIGTLFSRIKKGQIHFPRVADCGAYLDEFACEVAEYDDINRTVRYTHPETQQDDTLHATNYALLAATRSFQPDPVRWSDL